VSALTYSGTAEDRTLLIAEGNLDPDDQFTTLTYAEVRQRFAWVTRKVAYNAFWRGYEVATADAAAALEPFERPSLLSRIARWLS
jgi:hypothetical protein